MRSLALAVALAATGCSAPTTCTIDSDCSGQLCGADDECYPASQTHEVEIMWTVSGAAPTASSCSAMPTLALEFDTIDVTQAFEVAPVPCVEGKYTLDKLPAIYTEVDLGINGNFALTEPIGADNLATFDLTP